MQQAVQPNPSDEEWAWIESPRRSGVARGPRTSGMFRVPDECYGMPMYPVVFPRFPRSGIVFCKWRDKKLFEHIEDVFRGIPSIWVLVDIWSVRTAEDSGHDAGRKIEGRKRQVIMDTEPHWCSRSTKRRFKIATMPFQWSGNSSRSFR